MITLKEITECALENGACDTYFKPFLYAIKKEDYVLAWKIVVLKMDWLQHNGLDISLDDIPVDVDGETTTELDEGIIIKFNLLNKKLEGDYIVYRDNGLIRDIYTYNDGKLNGICEHYFYQSEILRSRHFYVNNKLHGEYKTFYEDGKIRTQMFYLDDKKEGEYKTFHENGKVERIAFCKGSHFHGEYKTFYKNGKPKTNGMYEYNRRVGKFTTLNKNGYIIEESEYGDGRTLIGVTVFNYDNGNDDVIKFSKNNAIY